MKIYVVYQDFDYEGCSVPRACFDSEEKAKTYIEKIKLVFSDYFYEVLELNEEY